MQLMAQRSAAEVAERGMVAAVSEAFGAGWLGVGEGARKEAQKEAQGAAGMAAASKRMLQ